MESIAINGTNHSQDFALSQSELLPGRAASPCSSIFSAASSTSSRKRTHDEISTLSTSNTPENESQGESHSEIESGRVQRPRLNPRMDEVSIFCWPSMNTTSNRSSDLLVDEVTEEQRDSLAHPDAVQRIAETHVNGGGDSSLATDTKQLNSGVSTQTMQDETTKKTHPPAPQQLPSPLASEDETAIQRVSPKRSGSKKGQYTLKPAGESIFRPQQPQKPFNPKPLPQKSHDQIFLESLRRRDRQNETKPALPSTNVQFHLKSVKQRGTPGKRQTPYSPLSALRMGTAQSRSARKPPASGLRKSERIANRVTKLGSKNLLHEAIARAKAEGKHEDELLRALLHSLNSDTHGRFLNLEEYQSRKRRIDAEVKRLKELGQQEVIPPLTPDQHQEWQKYFNEVKADYRRKLSKTYITKKFGKETLEVKTEDLATLAGVDAHGGWLNDNIILFYLALISERENRKGLRVILHNSFFYPKFLKDGFKGVSRWTAKKGASGMKILELDYIVVPICHSNHWTVGVINCKHRRFEYYDSLSQRPPSHHYENLRRYITAETAGQAELDGWENYWQPNAPKQQNGRDCGVFVIKTAEVVSRGARPSWDGAESEIWSLRKRMFLEIIHGQLMPTDD